VPCGSEKTTQHSPPGAPLHQVGAGLRQDAVSVNSGLTRGIEAVAVAGADGSVSPRWFVLPSLQRGRRRSAAGRFGQRSVGHHDRNPAGRSIARAAERPGRWHGVTFRRTPGRRAASVFIITADDIRRSGATTLPQVLRLAPTLDIARANSSQYAISARGFANVLANKTLVLIDGRTLYTPLFSGVFWEAQDIVLEDIDRIEVITGPSTALWGSNAVNALIHVITRGAAATQSTLAQARIGNREHVGRRAAGLRLGQSGHVRAYAKAYDRDASQRADGSSFNDSSTGHQLGFRADWALAAGGLSVQGNLYQGEVDQLPSARNFSGVNLLARWEQQLAASTRPDVAGPCRAHPTRPPLDLPRDTGHRRRDAEVGSAPLEGHRVLLGAGVRQSQSESPTSTHWPSCQPT
jgi:hypothetical protein